MNTATTSNPLVLKNASLPTCASAADSILIQNGRIQTLSTWTLLKNDLPANTKTIDLAGATVLPGLGDAHVHFAATGFLQTALDCSDMRTLQDLLSAIERISQQKNSGQLILGFRLQHHNFDEGRLPTLQELDAAAPHHPVYIRHITGHSSLANSHALELLDFPAGQAGVTLDDARQPSGYLIAQATQLATQRMYALNAQQVGYPAAFHAAARKAAEHGCTVVHALDDLGAVDALLQVEHTLPVRVIPYAQTFDLPAVQALGLPRIGGCHGCALDGDFDMYTAAICEPYVDRPGHYGTLYHDDDALKAFVLDAHKAGLQCAFHAVGDRAVEQALSAFEYAQQRHTRTNARHRIEHAQLIQPDHIARAKQAGVMLSVQPAFNHAWDHTTYPQWIGERANTIDPLASFQRAGIPLAGGSDSTVTKLEPLLGVHAAVNHSRTDERLSVTDALAMFTHGVAFSSFHEQQRGRIAVGYDADLSVVQHDIFQVDPATIKDVPVLMTIVNGRVVYEA